MKDLPILVNEALVRLYLPGGNPVGRHLLVSGAAHEIVGVIANLRGTAGSVSESSRAGGLLASGSTHEGVTGRYFVVRTSYRSGTTGDGRVGRRVHAVDPTQAIGSVATMDQLLDKAVAQPRLNLTVVASFAGIALALACVGIYGVVAFFVAQRTQEIGVRMALGSTRGGIARLFMRRALCAVGLRSGGGDRGCGGTDATAAEPTLWGDAGRSSVYLASVVVLLVPVVLATLRPAWIAASVDPAQALRSE